MRFDREYFLRDALEVGPEILGHYLIRKINGRIVKTMITEVEAYVGPEDEFRKENHLSCPKCSAQLRKSRVCAPTLSFS